VIKSRTNAQQTMTNTGIEIRELKWFGYLMRIEQEFSYNLFGHHLGRGNEENCEEIVE
jgi:hypothetical protein